MNKENNVATPVGEHFYRAGEFYRKEDDTIVVAMICGECNTAWGDAYKIGDVVHTTIKCPQCGFEECLNST